MKLGLLNTDTKLGSQRTSPVQEPGPEDGADLGARSKLGISAATGVPTKARTRKYLGVDIGGPATKQLQA